MSQTDNVVLKSAYEVIKKAKDVSINHPGVEAAAESLLVTLQATPYTTSSWATTALHPTPSLHPPAELCNWIFLVSTLNFSFWSELPSSSRYGVRWKMGTDGKGGEGTKVWTGYWSLLAALHRAREEGVAITDPRLWRDAEDDEIKRWFRSDQEEAIPLLEERVRVVREAGTVLCDSFDGSFENVLEQAGASALKLVELVVKHFPAYDDQTTYDGQAIFIRKRAQILVAEIWAAFDGQGPGKFDDIDQITMFADYRVPQILHSLSTIAYSENLVRLLKVHHPFANGCAEEVEIRAASIVAVEEIRLAVSRLATARKSDIRAPNAVSLDFFLWDLAKVEEEKGREVLPHHRTRSVFY